MTATSPTPAEYMASPDRSAERCERDRLAGRHARSTDRRRDLRCRPEYTGAASGVVNVAHQLGGSLGLGILVTVFAAASSGTLGPDELLAHCVSAALLTAGTLMVAIALALIVALIVRPARSADVASERPVGPVSA